MPGGRQNPSENSGSGLESVMEEPTAQKWATAKTSTIDRAASVSRGVDDKLWPVTGGHLAISTNDASATPINSFLDPHVT